MPTYLFKNNDSGEIFEEFISISERDEYVKNNNVTQLINGAPLVHSGRGLKKPDASFRELLTQIKKNNSRGTTKSTVNNY